MTFIVTDATVAGHYLRPLIRALFVEEVATYGVVVDPGEKSKTRRTKETIENEIISRGAKRDSVVIALGGGMVGDLAGFVASTLFRGIPFFQIPTTLLAQVDSSVGGKVGVDHPAGKNLIGAFYQPRRVYIDLATLDTLPDREYRSGLAEAVKYGAVMDAAFFAYLEEHVAGILARDRATLRHVVSRCCELKGCVVEADEREGGYRRILNFGHTLGHALELVSKYSLLHGEAVSAGMAMEAALASSRGLLPASDVGRLEALLGAFGLPKALPAGMKLAKVIDATASDKKGRGRSIAYTLLRAIGTAEIGVALTKDDVADGLL